MAPPAPSLSESLILAWADAHHAATGTWPAADLTPVAGGPPGLRWRWVNQALRNGARGLPGRNSLAGLLARERGRPHQRARPPLTERAVLAWARAPRRRAGSWPRIHEGAVAGRPGETWLGVDQALRKGLRGLPGGDSLPGLLARECGAARGSGRPPLTESRVLAWARDHRRRTGAWPSERCGTVAGAAGETWAAVSAALRTGRRGLSGGDSLAQLLHRRAGAPARCDPQRLTAAQVLAWAEAHQEETGRWPSRRAGQVRAAPGETWNALDQALRKGQRGLPAAGSLPRLLRRAGRG